MPIVTIEVVADSDRDVETGLAQSLADAIGRVLTSPSGQAWVRLRSLRRSQYAENETPVGDGEVPVFVTILERLPPSGTELEAEVAALTQAIAQALNRPVACVHIEYAPAAIGRVSFGGQLVK